MEYRGKGGTWAVAVCAAVSGEGETQTELRGEREDSVEVLSEVGGRWEEGL